MKSKFQYSRLYTRQRKSDHIIQLMDRRQQQPNKDHPNHLFSSSSPRIERTKTLKKSNYFESLSQSFSSQQKISQQNSQDKLEESVLKELASYMKKKELQGREFKWEEMLIGGRDEKSQDSNRTRTVVNNKHSHFKEDYFDEFFDDYDTSAYELEKYEFKENDEEFSNSKTLSINSSETEFIDSSSSHKEKKEKHSRKSSSSSDSSDIIEFALMQQKTKQNQHQKESKKLRQKKTQINYNEEDEDFEELWKMIVEQEAKNKKQENKKSKQDKFTRSSSPPTEVCKFQKKKNLHIQSPEQLQKQENSRRSNILVVSNQKKGKDQSNFCRQYLRESEQFRAKRLKKQKQEQVTCTICLCEIEGRSKLPCKHSFCRQCLIDWVSKTSNCPNCRKPADYYTFEGTKYPIEQKAYSLENYVDNIGQDSSEHQLDCQCYNCDDTQQGDELLVCDSCLVNASHVLCDPALKGREPAADRNWYCHICRANPNQWYRERRWR